jgi:hypothetical protein
VNMTLSLAYLKELGACWSDEQLEEAAKQWPSATPTWSWFLGERLDGLELDAFVLRMWMAAQHAHRRRIALPLKPAAVVAAAKAAEPKQRLRIASAFGAYLDAVADVDAAATDTQQVYRALATALALEL